MPDEPMLGEKTIRALGVGAILAREPDPTWGGPGVGVPCAVCDLPIERRQPEFEVRGSVRPRWWGARLGSVPSPRATPR